MTDQRSRVKAESNGQMQASPAIIQDSRFIDAAPESFAEILGFPKRDAAKLPLFSFSPEIFDALETKIPATFGGDGKARARARTYEHAYRYIGRAFMLSYAAGNIPEDALRDRLTVLDWPKKRAPLWSIPTYLKWLRRFEELGWLARVDGRVRLTHWHRGKNPDAKMMEATQRAARGYSAGTSAATRARKAASKRSESRVRSVKGFNKKQANRVELSGVCGTVTAIRSSTAFGSDLALAVDLAVPAENSKADPGTMLAPECSLRASILPVDAGCLSVVRSEIPAQHAETDIVPGLACKPEKDQNETSTDQNETSTESDFVHRDKSLPQSPGDGMGQIGDEIEAMFLRLGERRDVLDNASRKEAEHAAWEARHKAEEEARKAAIKAQAATAQGDDAPKKTAPRRPSPAPLQRGKTLTLAEVSIEVDRNFPGDGIVPRDLARLRPDMASLMRAIEAGKDKRRRTGVANMGAYLQVALRGILDGT